MTTLFSKDIKRFNHLMGEIEKEYHETSLKLGMSDSAFNILYTICNFGDRCLISEIVKLSGMSKQTANSSIRKLEAEGIIKLEAYDGKRKTAIVTDKGKALIKDTVAKIINIENEIFAEWSREEVELYIGLTNRYLKEFKERAKGV